MDANHHLACQACQRKKIRCDRTFPCGQCQKSSLHCVPSTRKARARRAIGKRAADSELRTRISKLESLVETLSSEVGMPEDESIAERQAFEDSGKAASPTTGKYIGNPFWSTLSNEVQALRDALLDDESDEEPPPDSPTTSTGMAPADHDLLVCPPGLVYVMPGALPEPPPRMASQLVDIFFDNVDPVFKVLHKPTVRRFLDHDQPYLGHNANSPPNRALKSAMWFVAICTLRDADCFARFGQTRSDLLHLYKRHCDVTLTQADLIVTTDLATVQACVLYTAASRMTDSTRRPWTMVGLIIRVANGMTLHHEDQRHTPFEKEMRRRLWYQIRVLDAFAAADRGTEVLIPLTSFSTPPPSNVNDDEFDESSGFVPHREHGMTDMSFCLMSHAATELTMRLLTPEHTPKGETWQQRLDQALELGKELREKYLKYCDASKPFHRFMNAVGNSMAASSALRAVRPMQKHVSSVPPRVDSPFVLQLAVNSLRESDATHQDPEAAGWRWIFWVQWHALAVALAGLCSIRETELADAAWLYVEKSYERASRQVADSKSGMLWKPIEKLYKKAIAFRDHSSPTFTPQIASRNVLFDNDVPDLATSAWHQPVNSDQSIAQANVPLATTSTQDATYNGNITGDFPSDMTWLDWERIMEDISFPMDMAIDASGLTLDDLNYPYRS